MGEELTYAPSGNLGRLQDVSEWERKMKSISTNSPFPNQFFNPLRSGLHQKQFLKPGNQNFPILHPYFVRRKSRIRYKVWVIDGSGKGSKLAISSHAQHHMSVRSFEGLVRDAADTRSCQYRLAWRIQWSLTLVLQLCILYFQYLNEAKKSPRSQERPAIKRR